MTDEELTFLLKETESDRSERTESYKDGDKLRQAVCAFANDLPSHGKPGVLFVGAKDDGSCAGIDVTDDLLLRLSDIRSDGNTIPFPSINVEKRILAGCELAIVVVQPSLDTPVRYKGRVWVRVGPRKAVASPDEERRLTEKRRSRDLPYDLQPMWSAQIDDLDVGYFQRNYLPSALSPDVLEANGRTPTEQLASLRFLTSDVPPQPTVLGLLVTGRDPRQFLPGAYVQFLRIDGEEITDAIKDQKDLDGPLPEMLRRVDETLEAHISVATDVVSHSLEIRHPDVPIVALQQVCRNAVLHRNYEGTNAPVRITWFNDRVEIISPGGPFGQVTKQNFGQPNVTDYRNPHIAEAMKNLGYVQKFGLGLQLARRELEKNGNPPPIFDVQDTYVLVKLRIK